MVKRADGRQDHEIEATEAQHVREGEARSTPTAGVVRSMKSRCRTKEA